MCVSLEMLILNSMHVEFNLNVLVIVFWLFKA